MDSGNAYSPWKDEDDYLLENASVILPEWGEDSNETQCQRCGWGWEEGFDPDSGQAVCDGCGEPIEIRRSASEE